MKGISISTCFDYEISFRRQVELIHNTGFTHISIGGQYNHSGILESKNYCEIDSIINDNNLSIDTIHGYALDKTDTFDVNKRLAEAASSLNIPVIVLHCSSFTINPNTFDKRKKDIISKIPLLEKLAETYNVNFAFENLLPGISTELAEFAVNNSDPKYFGFCYDSSHDQIDGPRPFDLLKRNVSRLKAVHISDRICEFVDHVTPNEGFIDFEKIAKIINQNNPSFPLLMEVATTHSSYKNTDEFLAITYRKALKLYDMINID